MSPADAATALDTNAPVAPHRWLALLANLALVVGIPGTAVLALCAWVTEGHRDGGGIAFLVLAAGGVALVLIGRVGPGVGPTFGIVVTTWITFAVASVSGLLIMFGDCTTVEVNQSWIPWVAGGAVYLAIGSGLALRGRWLWGLPAAVVLAIVVGVSLALKLPGIPVGSVCPE